MERRTSLRPQRHASRRVRLHFLRPKRAGSKAAPMQPGEVAPNASARSSPLFTMETKSAGRQAGAVAATHSRREDSLRARGVIPMSVFQGMHCSATASKMPYGVLPGTRPSCGVRSHA
jgi:hypothetical protein